MQAKFWWEGLFSTPIPFGGSIIARSQNWPKVASLIETSERCPQSFADATWNTNAQSVLLGNAYRTCK